MNMTDHYEVVMRYEVKREGYCTGTKYIKAIIETGPGQIDVVKDYMERMRQAYPELLSIVATRWEGRGYDVK